MLPIIVNRKPYKDSDLMPLTAVKDSRICLENRSYQKYKWNQKRCLASVGSEPSVEDGINSFPNDKILDLSKLKAFADDKGGSKREICSVKIEWKTLWE